MNARSLLLAVLITAAAAHDGSGQRITGRVVEEGTDRGVGTALVSLLGGDSAVAARVLTDSAGFFLVDGATPGIYRLRAERLGFAVVISEPIDLIRGEVVNVVLRMSARGIPLAPLEVRARGARERGRDGFERRRALGLGVFLTEDSVRRRSPAVATDAFYGIPKITIMDAGRGANVYSLSGGKCLVIYVDNHVFPVQVGRPPTTAQMRRGAFVIEDGLNWFVGPDQIRGIEVYRNFSEVPVELRTAVRMIDLSPPIGSLRQVEPCGLAWVWTNGAW
jgi:hypothetical protein